MEGTCSVAPAGADAVRSTTSEDAGGEERT